MGDAPRRVDGLDRQREAFLVTTVGLGRQLDDRVTVIRRMGVSIVSGENDRLHGTDSGILM